MEIKRILLNNSKLSILDKEYLWQFPKSSSNEFEDLNSETVSTPQKQIGIPEQPPNSCPDFKVCFFVYLNFLIEFVKISEKKMSIKNMLLILSTGSKM